MPYSLRLAGLIPLSLFLVFAWPLGQATAQEDEGFFRTRCDPWNNMLNEWDRFIYMEGLRDGLIFSKMVVQDIELPTMSSQEAVRAVNWVCNDPANSQIPIPFVLKVAGMRALGMSQQLIEEELSKQRALFQSLN